MRDRQGCAGDGLDAADAFMFGIGCDRRGSRRRRRHPFGGAAQAGFGIDQELAGGDDLLPGTQSRQDFHPAVGFTAGLDLGGHEAGLAGIDHDDAALAGADDRLGGDQQGFLVLAAVEPYGREHARHETLVLVGQHDADFDRARRRTHVRQDGVHLARCRFRHAGRRDLGRHPWRNGTCLAFRYLGNDPDLAQIGQAEQRHARRHRHPVAHGHLCDQAIDRAGDAEARLQLAGTDDSADLTLRHAGLQHARLGRAGQIGLTECLLVRDRQIFFLGGDPVGRIQRHQCLAPADRLQRRTNRDVLHERTGTGLDDLHAALVHGDIARRLQHGAQASQPGLGRADTQVLSNAAVDGDAAAASLPVRVDRHELHVHERRLARLVETLARHHRVVPVQHLLAGLRIDVAGLETRRA
ncbi:hypothetical protein ACEQUB_p00243 (plasmid) [Ralstonia syzygii]